MKRHYILVLIAVLIGCEITNLPDREEEGAIIIPVTIGGGPFGDTDATDAALPEEGRFGSRVRWTAEKNGYPEIKSLLATPVWITHRLGNSFQPYENAGQVTDERRRQILVNLKRTPSLVQVHGLPGENRFSIKIEDYMRQNSWQVIGIGLTKKVTGETDGDSAMTDPGQIEAFVEEIDPEEAIWFAFDPVFWNEYYNRRRSGTVHVTLEPACATSTLLTNCDDTDPGITVGMISGATSEAGGMATFTVRLNTQPTANVTVTPTSSDTTEGTVSGALTFTADNWGTPQTVTVTGVDDSLVDGNQTYQIEFTVASADGDYNGFTLTPVVEVTNSDDDSAGITVGSISGATSEAGGMATFTVRLNTQPTADVVVTPTSSDTDEGTVSAPLTFNTSNWSTAQTVTVTGVDDSLVDGNQTYQIDFTVASADGDYNGFTLTPVAVTNSDDDSAGITAVATDATTDESGETATIDVRLNTQPSANVVVTPDSSDTDEGTVSGALTFSTSNWGMVQTITVTGMDDNMDNGDGEYEITFSVASADGDYNGLTVAPVDVTNSAVVAFEWIPSRDLDTLQAAGNDAPFGLWSDGTTMWVADEIDDKIYAYNLSTKARDAGRDFETLDAAGNDAPFGLWSDGTTMWVADSHDDKIYAYSLSTKARIPSRDFDTLRAAGNTAPFGLWSDGTTMWVADEIDDKIYAYNLSTKARDAGRDFDTLQAASNNSPLGLWSDGTTMWVSDFDDAMIYAYKLSTKARNASRDFNTLDAAGNDIPQGLWSDGTTMWVPDFFARKIYAYRMP